MKRFWILGVALAVTLAALALPMILGSVVFNFSRFQDHEGRLRRVMRQQPTVDRLDQAFRDEGTVLLAVLRSPDEAAKEAVSRGGPKAAEIRQKASRRAQTRLYQAGDMLYFIYFDADGVMRDFTCVSR